MSARLDRLLALRGEFDHEASRERRALITSLARIRWRSAEEISAFHDELLFVAAFPDSVASHRLAIRVLGRIGASVRALPTSQLAILADTGIAGSVTSHAFMYGVARWLALRGERIAFDWTRDKDAERLDSLLRFAVRTAEEDWYDSDEVGSKRWMDEAGRRSTSTASWLLAAAPDGSAAAEGRAWRTAYDQADPPVCWSLEDSRFSTSRNRIAVPPVIRSSFRKLPRDPVALIETPLRGIRRARGAEAERWHEASLAALAARTREVFPTIHANPREIVLAPLGEGATLCLLGAAIEDRSVLEANYGYVIFANGVPVGYGGFTTLGAQANTGANVFESFRGSEAPFLYAQALRAVRTHLGVTRFLVNPYQIGAGNDEAISSGAYWFYDRLGFRPVERSASALADRERAIIAADRSHRSTLRTLRTLARSDLVLRMSDASRLPLLPESALVAASRRATVALAAVPAGERDRWILESASDLLRRCTGVRRVLTSAERRGAAHLMPMLAPLVPRLHRWSLPDRRALWRLVALKGAAQERGFARAAAGLAPLWRALGFIDS